MKTRRKQHTRRPLTGDAVRNRRPSRPPQLPLFGKLGLWLLALLPVLSAGCALNAVHRRAEGGDRSTIRIHDLHHAWEEDGKMVLCVSGQKSRRLFIAPAPEFHTYIARFRIEMTLSSEGSESNLLPGRGALGFQPGREKERRDRRGMTGNMTECSRADVCGPAPETAAVIPVRVIEDAALYGDIRIRYRDTVIPDSIDRGERAFYVIQEHGDMGGEGWKQLLYVLPDRGGEPRVYRVYRLYWHEKQNRAWLLLMPVAALADLALLPVYIVYLVGMVVGFSILGAP